jgi:hypothetical protein
MPYLAVPMAKCDEISVALLIARELRVSFSGRKFSLGGWGEIDDYVDLGRDRFLFLEVETGQKHPNTNVLKVWPFLEANATASIVLVQAFFPDSPGCNSSRGRLGCWLGDKLQALLPGRFSYHRLIVARDSCSVVEGLSELRQTLKQARERP